MALAPGSAPVQVQSQRFYTLSTEHDAIRTQRWSMCGPRASASQEQKPERRRSRSKDLETPGERALRVCTYSGSSGSDTETEPETPTTISTGPEEQSEQTLKRCSVGKGLSIMDYYQQEVFPCLEEGKRRSRYSLLHQEEALEGTPAHCLTDGNKMSSFLPSRSRPDTPDCELEKEQVLRQ
ncbi:hypothetical protein WMY93_022799 [Mugilogobius chulae]|uniref:Uncharacterized protein n=1 Tax=Mugilogobius chulae TaxID=88201 RepID=A0AAW0NCG6_9GOBI